MPRITEQVSQTQLNEGDVFLIDNPITGTHKISEENLGKSINDRVDVGFTTVDGELNVTYTETDTKTEPTLKNETFKAKVNRLQGILRRQNVLISEMIDTVATTTPVATLNEIHEIVQNGEAEKVFNIGDQINVNYNNGTSNYILPFDIVAFKNVELQDGETVPGMIIQCHYAMEGVQFDQNEGFYVVPAAGLAAGSYYITMGDSWGSNVVSGKSYTFTLTNSYAEGDILQLGTASSEISGLPDTAPSNWRVRAYKGTGSTSAAMLTTPTEIVTPTEGTTGTFLGTLSSSTKYLTNGMNNMQRASYGYNRWSQSALRQRLNSLAGVGAWWIQQNPYDRRPDQLSSVRGFMAGFDEAFLNIIKPVKVRTALNTVTDGDIGTYEDTYDTFFLPSLEEEYIIPQADGVEGTYWPYWKRRLGLTSPQGWYGDYANAAHIRYAYENHASAQYCRLRSAYRGVAYLAWLVTAAGYASNGFYATTAIRCAPACVVC